MAHEIAHLLGAVHDCTSKNCDGSCTDSAGCQCNKCDSCDCHGQYIMDPNQGGGRKTKFSPPTIQQVCEKLPYLGSCLKDQGSLQTDLISVCGNGIREGAEECDCGDAASCAKTKCCTKDCKLTAGSQCYEGNDPCCNECMIIQADAQHVCREATSSCQENALCDGTDRSCPDTVFKRNGSPCEDGQACASGVCTSRALQCAVFGQHINITETCPYSKRSCSIICKQEDKEECLDLSATFVDGTPCGEKGTCLAGMCSEFGSSSDPRGYHPATRSALTIL